MRQLSMLSLKCKTRANKNIRERPDIIAIREAAGADVSSTTPIAQIGKYFLG